MDRTLYPLFLDLSAREVLVVGAGAAGMSKVTALLQAGAAVTLVAPAARPELEQLASRGLITWHRRSFTETDLDDVWLVVAATGDPLVNREICRAGSARRLFINAVDDPESATAYSAAVLRRGPITIALSSAGRAPVLLRLLREILSDLLPAGDILEAWVAHAEQLRPGWRARAIPIGSRFPAFLRYLLEREEGRTEAS